MTQMIEVEAITLTPEFEPADPNKRAHIVRGAENEDLWEEGMVAQDLVNLARDLGLEVTALCGHKWIPTRDPAKHDICQVCIKIWERI